MDLSGRKIIVFFIIILVVILVSSNFSKISNLTKSGFTEMEEKQCQTTPDVLKVSKISNCGLVDVECDDEEKEEWKKALNYLGTEKAEVGCEKLSKDDDEKNDCTCIQEIIWKKLSEMYKKGDDIIGVENQMSEVELKNELESAKNCKVEKEKFDGNIVGTPYWVTNVGELGTSDFRKGLATIVKDDTKGTHSYGNFGLNSKSGAIDFWKMYGDELGLGGTPGEPDGDASWSEVVKNKPEELMLAEIKWYNEFVIKKTLGVMKSNDFPENFINNPPIIAYLSDVTIQGGLGSTINLIKIVKPKSGESPEDYLQRLTDYQTSDEYLRNKFASYLDSHPNSLDGLKSRVLDKRLPLSKEVKIVYLDDERKVVCS